MKVLKAPNIHITLGTLYLCRIRSIGSIPISIEVICNVVDLTRNAIDISMEPLQLEYEGVPLDEYTYTITFKFDREESWRVAIASRVVPYYFVLELGRFHIFTKKLVNVTEIY